MILIALEFRDHKLSCYNCPLLKATFGTKSKLHFDVISNVGHLGKVQRGYQTKDKQREGTN